MSLLRKIAFFPFWIISLIFGELSWQRPIWVSYCQRAFKQKPFVFVLISLLAISLISSGLYAVYQWKSSPKTPLVIAKTKLANPFDSAGNSGLRKEDIKPASLTIDFMFESVKGTELDKDDLQVRFKRRGDNSPSQRIAALDMINIPLQSGIQIYPNIKGEWRWETQQKLVFDPSSHWLPGTNYTLKLDDSLFAQGIELKRDEIEIPVDRLEVAIDEFDFYQDPTQPANKRFKATISSNFPIASATWHQLINLKHKPTNDDALSTSDKRTLNFEVHTNESETLTYISSEALELPAQTQYFDLLIAGQAKASIGGKELTLDIKAQSLLPDIYSMLDIESLSLSIIEDKQQTPNQVMSLSFTDAVAHSQLASKLKIFQLPAQYKDNTNVRWRNIRDVPSALLNDANLLEYELLNQHLTATTNHQLVIKAKANSQVYAYIDDHISSVNAYIKQTPYAQILNVPDYPKQLFFDQSGMMMSNSYQPRLGVGSRGLDAIEFQLGRVPEHQLVHLITQTNGNLNNPVFRTWSFNEFNLVNFERIVLPLANGSANELNKAALDLSKYLNDKSSGMFFVNAYGFRPHNKSRDRSVKDSKLVLLTDIGILSKHESDEQTRIYVSSLQKGTPIESARVQILSRSGDILDQGLTNADGTVIFTDLQTLSEGKEATVILVKKGDDLGFLPFNEYSNMVDYNRELDTEVSAHWGMDEEIKSYLFNDRGIYKPGETVKLAAIVKSADLSSLMSQPVELVVRDPQYKEIFKQTVVIEKANHGFVEFSVATQPQFVSGQYQASLHMVEHNQAQSNTLTVNPRTRQRGRTLTSSTFELQHFEADTLRLNTAIKTAAKKPVADTQKSIHSYTSLTGLKGWHTAGLSDDLYIDLQLDNLYGEPAVLHQVEIDYQLNSTQFYFEKYKGVSFFNMASTKDYNLIMDFVKATQAKHSKQTDNFGHAQFALDLPEGLVGHYELRINSKGFELDSAKYVDTVNTLNIAGSEQIIGHKTQSNLAFIKQNQVASIDLLAINSKLEQVKFQNLVLKRLQSNTVSTLVKQANGELRYQDETFYKDLESTPFSIPKEGVVTLLHTGDIGDYRLQLFTQQGSKVWEADYSVVGDGEKAIPFGRGAMLDISLNKKDYQPGELIQVAIDAPYKGHGLITIESSRVHAHKWFKTDNLSSVHEISLPSDIEGSAYINVSFIRATDASDIALSPFSYGLASFSIDKSKREIDVQLSVPALIDPQENTQIQVSTDRPADVLVFAVNTGILQISGYSQPNPLRHFLRKKALGVRSYQMLDQLIPNIDLTEYFAARYLASPGGDDMEAMSMRARFSANQDKGISQNPFAVRQHEPAVYWSGITKVEGGDSQLSIDLPDDFTGELRFYAVAVSDNRFGVSSATSEVKSDFLIEASLPSHIAPTDTLDTSILIRPFFELAADSASEANSTSKEDKNLKSASVETRTKVVTNVNHQIRVSIEHSKNLAFYSKLSGNVSIDESGLAQFLISFTANDQLGEAWIEVKTSLIDMGDGKSEHSYESTRRFYISNRPSSLAIYKGQYGLSRDAKNIMLEGPLYDARRQQTLSITTRPSIFTHNIKQSMLTQSIESAEQLIAILNIIASIELHANRSAPTLADQSSRESTKQNTKRNKEHFDKYFKRLLSLQLPNGGIAESKYSRRVNAHLSLMALDMLQKARKSALTTRPEAYFALLDYADKLARDARGTAPNDSAPDNIVNRSYAIYLLTKEGRVTTNYLLNIKNNSPEQSWFSVGSKQSWSQNLSLAYQAASYLYMQQGDQAQRLFDAIDWQLDASTSQDISFQLSSISLGLKYLLGLDSHALSQSNKLIPDISVNTLSQLAFDQLNQGTTFFQAGRLGDILPFLDAPEGANSSDLNPSTLKREIAIEVQARLFNQTDTSILTPQAPKSETTEHNKEHLKLLNEYAQTFYLANGFRDISINRDSSESTDRPIYYQLIQQGFHQVAQATANGIEVDKRLLDADGALLKVNPKGQFEVKQGDALSVEVLIRRQSTDTKTDTALSNIKLVDLLPAGFQIIKGSVESNAPLNAQPDAQYVKEISPSLVSDSVTSTNILADRLVMELMLGQQVLSIRYQIKPMNSGLVALPTSKVIDLDDAYINAATAPTNQKIKILPIPAFSKPELPIQ